METRMERTKRKKKEKRKRIFKRLIFCSLFVLLYLGLVVTEKSIQELSGENSGNIFFTKLNSGEFNFNYFKNILKKICEKLIK
ncbi:hypothetical protein [Anaerosalibacter massiliensis]|uniref:Uncharacterized protein n=1 Tax=Anaerosalibacter massiliensis TaxID=1347392 RepID=A0A9X2MKS9_9FIRM|nr:hypothetical protein [Anaerosalibacter massiliensis]MCR2044967.1 hypothetical protein [Anaerosalibacter massiliensis]